MIRELEIDNYRVFQEFKLDDIGTINLIGGLNNSGKTSLLDWLCLNYDGVYSNPIKIENHKLTLDIWDIKPHDIIMIDNIEQGFHYTFFKEMWKLLLQMSKVLCIQIFATTHSKEMAEALCEISDESGRYIELMTHYKTKRIVSVTMEMDILNHKLINNQAFRGE